MRSIICWDMSNVAGMPASTDAPAPSSVMKVTGSHPRGGHLQKSIDVRSVVEQRGTHAELGSVFLWAGRDGCVSQCARDPVTVPAVREGHDGRSVFGRGIDGESLFQQTGAQPVGEGNGVSLDVLHAHVQEVVECGAQLIYRAERHGGVTILARVGVQLELVTAEFVGDVQ